VAQPPARVAPAPAAAKAAPSSPAGPTGTEVAVEVSSHPSGARVSIDGAPAGETPLHARVAPGRHTVAFSHERYEPHTAIVEAPGQLEVTLKRPLATLKVSSTPAAATVVVQGQPRGRTPLELRLPGYERYDVQVAIAGGRAWRKQVYVKAPATELQATLADKPKQATLSPDKPKR
jgi:hypothetical protein